MTSPQPPPDPPFRPRPHSSRGVFAGSSAPQGGGSFVGREGRRTPHALPHISDFQPQIPPISTHTPQIEPQIRGFGAQKAHFGSLSNAPGDPEMPISATLQASWRAKRAKRANRTSTVRASEFIPNANFGYTSINQRAKRAKRASTMTTCVDHENAYIDPKWPFRIHTHQSASEAN